MATLYNKTALKKVKKDKLVQMFLDQQAELNQVLMEAEELSDRCIKLLEIPKKLHEENEKLKEKLLSKSEELTNIRREKSELEEIIFENMKKNSLN